MMKTVSLILTLWRLDERTQSCSVLRTQRPGHTHSALEGSSSVTFQRKYVLCRISSVPHGPYILFCGGVVSMQRPNLSARISFTFSFGAPPARGPQRQCECMRPAPPPALYPIVYISMKKQKRSTNSPRVRIPRRRTCVGLRNGYPHDAQRHERERIILTPAEACRLTNHIYEVSTCFRRPGFQVVQCPRRWKLAGFRLECRCDRAFTVQTKKNL